MEVEAISLLPDWMRPPSWRWTAAMHIASRCSKNLPTYEDLKTLGFKKDKALLKAARYYTIRYRPDLGGASVSRVRYPDIYRASLIFKGDSYFAYWKEILEAMFLTDLSLPNITRKLGIGQDTKLVKLYRDLFFDVDAYKNNETCLQTNIISVCCKGAGLEPTEDYLSKLTAYQKGYDAFYRLFVSRESSQMTDEDADWLQNLMKTKLSMKAVSLASSSRASYITENMEILKTGREWIVNDSVDTDALGDKAKSEALSQLLSTVHSVCDEASEAADTLTGEDYEGFVDVDWAASSEESEEEEEDS